MNVLGRSRVIDSVVLDPCILSVTDRATGNRADGAPDQRTGSFIVSLIANRSADRGPGKSAEDRTSTPMRMVLCVDNIQRRTNQYDRDQVLLVHLRSPCF